MPAPVPVEGLGGLPQGAREVDAEGDLVPRPPRGYLRLVVHDAQPEDGLRLVEVELDAGAGHGAREGGLLAVEELDVLLREEILGLELPQIIEDLRRVLVEEGFRLPQGLPVSEAHGHAEALLPETVAAVHVGLEILGVHLVRFDPVAVLDEDVQGLRRSALIHELRREDGGELAALGCIHRADRRLGVDARGAQERLRGLRPPAEPAEIRREG